MKSTMGKLMVACCVAALSACGAGPMPGDQGSGAPEQNASVATDDNGGPGMNGGSCSQCLGQATHSECGGSAYCCAEVIAQESVDPSLSRPYYTSANDAKMYCGVGQYYLTSKSCGGVTATVYYCIEA